VIVVANACFSARISDVTVAGALRDLKQRETGLVPSLADQFFCLGVRNYIGTAWEVNDIGAELFARRFYDRLLLDPGGGAGPASIGGRARRPHCAVRAEGPLRLALGRVPDYGDPTTEARVVNGS
jgi:hypothetical protein